MTSDPARIRRLPNWHPAAATTLGTRHTIWVKDRYRSDPEILAHEAVHLRQAQSMLPGMWLFGYVLKPRFRFKAEAEAYAESVRHGASVEDCARWLSSWLYLKCCTYGEAVQAIRGFLA